MVNINNTELQNMTYNGQEVNTWIHNGVEVFSKITNGIRYIIDCDPTKTNYPVTVYKQKICGYKNNGNWVFFDDFVNYTSENVEQFTFDKTSSTYYNDANINIDWNTLSHIPNDANYDDQWVVTSKYNEFTFEAPRGSWYAGPTIGEYVEDTSRVLCAASKDRLNRLVITSTEFIKDGYKIEDLSSLDWKYSTTSSQNYHSILANKVSVDADNGTSTLQTTIDTKGYNKIKITAVGYYTNFSNSQNLSLSNLPSSVNYVTLPINSAINVTNQRICNNYLYFDCPGDTFDLRLSASTANPGYQSGKLALRGIELYN